MLPETLQWRGDSLVLLDQRVLPGDVRYLVCRDVEAVAVSIETLAVRGAPAIGIAAAYGMVLAARTGGRDALAGAKDRLARTRPTAVNLFWALERMLAKSRSVGDATLVEELLDEAVQIHEEDIAMNRAMSANGAALLPQRCAVLTHCNAGALATGGYGTALGIIRAAVRAGKNVQVYADETRPLLQGARLTAWELQQEGIPVTLICDNMVGALMASGRVNAVIVGADRIAANGDVANKIGTYGVAILARHHGIPFYVAAPTSTFDPSLPHGAAIPIEERNGEEVRSFGGVRTAPEGIPVWNPAFDVTPGALITAIISEESVTFPPYCFGTTEKRPEEVLGGGNPLSKGSMGGMS
jgi:methylthioribose-1-phosphate isomerase